MLWGITDIQCCAGCWLYPGYRWRHDDDDGTAADGTDDGTADGTAGDGTGGGRDQLIRTREAGAVLGGSHQTGHQR